MVILFLILGKFNSTKPPINKKKIRTKKRANSKAIKQAQDYYAKCVNDIKCKEEKIKQKRQTLQNSALKNCTFKPKKYSSLNSTSNLNFLERNSQWQQSKNIKIKEKINQKAKKAMDQCTFRPKLNHSNSEYREYLFFKISSLNSMNTIPFDEAEFQEVRNNIFSDNNNFETEKPLGYRNQNLYETNKQFRRESDSSNRKFR